MDNPRPLGLDLSVWLVLTAATAIAVELRYLRHRRQAVDYRDAAHSMLLGLSWAGIRIIGGKVLFFGAWLWTWRHVSLFDLDPLDPRAWLAYWLTGDLLYYWTHRAEHRFRVLWSTHVVHHSSEQFNLATAVRQSWTEVFYKPLIALWAPLLGFHPVMYVTVGAVSLAVGQWQHLAWFPKVRALDALVMSPSNHRVHHGRNIRYIDRNFGGGLVLWDKLFGTYEPETEATEYGVLHLPAGSSVVSRSLCGHPELIRDMRLAGGVRAAARVALGRPV